LKVHQDPTRTSPNLIQVRDDSGAYGPGQRSRSVKSSRLGLMLLLAVLVGVGALSTQAAGRRLPARSEPSVRPSIPLRCPRLVAFFVRLHPDGGPSDLGRLVHPISAPSMPTDFPGPVTLIYTSPSPNNPPKPDCEGGLSDTTVLVWYPASLRGAKALRHQRINGIAVDGPRSLGNGRRCRSPSWASSSTPRARRPGRCSIRSPTRPGRPSPSSFPRRRYRRTGVADCRRSAVRRTVELVTRSLGKETPTARKRQPLWMQPNTVLLYSGGQASITGGGMCPERDGPRPYRFLVDQEGAVLSSPPLSFYGMEYITGPTSMPCARIHSLRICLSPGDNTLFGPGLYTIRRPSSRKIVTLTIGLAGDGLVARTIIGSFRPA